ncbi:MAG: glycosyltransferase [Planctomycetota bacterium]
MWNFRSQTSIPDEVERFLNAGEPPIVFTPGSANIQARAFFATAVEACVRLGRRGILLTEFEEHLPAQIPSSVARFSYVPLDLMLQRCSSIVHHGGIGTTSQGMMAGIPQLIMPMAYDQFDNAERLVELGVGTAVPVHAFQPARVTRALHALLANPDTIAKCQTVAKRLNNTKGLERSADAVERLVMRAIQKG